MARILWLPGVLRAAGLDVVEEPGWRTRGRDDFDPFGLIAHATAGGLQQSNDSAVSVMINGRVGLAGPIGQAMIERGTGRWRIVASGAGNHAKTGWAGPLRGLGNRRLIGVECHHDNLRESWTPTVYQSYAIGMAAICRHMGWDPMRRIAAHKEHQPGEKSDPTFNPDSFRALVRDHLAGQPLEDVMTPEQYTVLANTHDRVQALVTGQPYGNQPAPAWAEQLEQLEAKLDALATKVASIGTAGVDLQAIEDAAFRGAQRAESV